MGEKRHYWLILCVQSVTEKSVMSFVTLYFLLYVEIKSRGKQNGILLIECHGGNETVFDLNSIKNI